jgi:hypothetical protein
LVVMLFQARGVADLADDKLRVSTVVSYDVKSGGHRAKSAFAHLAMLSPCGKR